jgi:hypothetical protein
MARIEGEIVIGRPADVVFDYVADRRKGAFVLLAPVIAWMGGRQERTVWAAMKHRLEMPEAAA